MLPQARKDEILVQEVDGETLVYDLESNKAICLNETSAIIWANCDGQKNALEIAKEVEKKLGSPVNEEFVWFAINQLNKESLLKPKADFSDKFAGMSRREVIKKIGITSMIALPIVASMIAPPVAFAQSCILPMGDMTTQPGCPCGATQDCLPSVMCSVNPMGVPTCAGT